jgi:hypothetical protein
MTETYDDDPILGDDGYPHQIELDRIEHWMAGLDGQSDWTASMIGLMNYVKRRWKYAEVGYWTEHLDTGDGTLFYSISTGGWSGNEELIMALEGSTFWLLTFESMFRGGHYVFKVKQIKKGVQA